MTVGKARGGFQRGPEWLLTPLRPRVPDAGAERTRACLWLPAPRRDRDDGVLHELVEPRLPDLVRCDHRRGEQGFRQQIHQPRRRRRRRSRGRRMERARQHGNPQRSPHGYFFTVTTTLPPGVSVIVFGSGWELPLSDSGSLATTGRS